MKRYDRPILFDDFTSFDHGPVDLRTYAGISSQNLCTPWSDYIKICTPWSEYKFPCYEHEIGLARQLKTEDFDELSPMEERVLDDVLDEHRHRRGFELVDWIRLNCGEWSSPLGTPQVLPYREVWKALGRTNLDEMEKHIDELKSIAAFMKEHR